MLFAFVIGSTMYSLPSITLTVTLSRLMLATCVFQSSPRFVRECAKDEALHLARGSSNADGALYTKGPNSSWSDRRRMCQGAATAAITLRWRGTDVFNANGVDLPGTLTVLRPAAKVDPGIWERGEISLGAVSRISVEQSTAR